MTNQKKTNDAKPPEYFMERANRVDEWVDANPTAAKDIGQILTMQAQLLRGAANDEKAAMGIWRSIAALASGRENTFIQKGRQSSLSAHQVAAVNSVKNAVQTAFAGFCDSKWSLLQNLILPRGGGVHATPDEMAEYFANMANRAMTEAVKDGRWNYTHEKGMPTDLTPRPPKETEAASEAVSEATEESEA